MFKTYLELGFKHILDVHAYDHVLFVLTLCAVYTSKEWRKVVILATAFTIGHSLTLALAVTKLISISPPLIETLIPITIIITAISNIYHAISKTDTGRLSYLLTLIFGLIHGLGFSTMLKALLGAEDDFLIPLLSFNLGVELGQLPIVIFAMILSYLMINIVKCKAEYWNIILSIFGIIIATNLLIK